MTFAVYMLRCADGSYYTGHTDDLERRLAQHQSGATTGYTSTRLPVELVWSEAFPTREEALGAEQRVKAWSRAKKEALIAGDWQRMKRASAPPMSGKQDPRLRSATPLDFARGERRSTEPS